MKKRLIAILLSMVICLSFGAVAMAADEVEWPDGNVNLIIAAAPGGGTDLIGRKVAEVANRITGDNYIIVNQDEGNGAVAFNTVYSDDEDGLNLGFFISSFFTSYITGATDEHPLEDFKVASYVNRESCAYICVKADSEYESIDQLLDYAREHPGEVVFGISLGSRTHFRIEEFAQAAGVEFKYVEAGKTAEAIAGLLGGHITVTSLSASAAESYAENGDIRLLACSDEPINRSEVNEGVPTYADLGYTDLKCLDPVMIVTGKEVPDEVVMKINEVMTEVFSDEELKDYMKNEGTVITPYDYEETQQWYKDTFDVYDSVGETLGVKADRG